MSVINPYSAPLEPFSKLFERALSVTLKTQDDKPD